MPDMQQLISISIFRGPQTSLLWMSCRHSAGLSIGWWHRAPVRCSPCPGELPNRCLVLTLESALGRVLLPRKRCKT